MTEEFLKRYESAIDVAETTYVKKVDEYYKIRKKNQKYVDLIKELVFEVIKTCNFENMTFDMKLITPDILDRTVGNPLYMLAMMMKDEKQNDIVLIRISYDNDEYLNAWAPEFISNNTWDIDVINDILSEESIIVSQPKRELIFISLDASMLLERRNRVYVDFKKNKLV